jgi:signal transduction histidine kinase
MTMLSEAELLAAPRRLEDASEPDAAASFAGRALRVLDGLALAITVAPDGDHGERQLAASAGTRADVARLLSPDGWAAAAGSGRPGVPGDAPGTSIVEHGELGELRISRALEDGDHAFGTLHVLCPSTWPVDARTHRMVSVIAETAASFVPADGSRCATVSASARAFTAAKLLAELALTANSYHEMVGGVVATVCPLVDAAKGGVALWHERDFYLQMLSGSFGVPPEFVASSQAAPSDPNSPAARVITTRRAWFTNSAERDMWDYRDFIRGFGVSQMMILPLARHDRAIGVMHVANKQTPFSESDVRTLELITPLVAAVLEHVRERLEMERKEALARVVSDAATTIASGQPLQGFSSSLYDFCHSVGARMMVVSFVDGSPQIVVKPGEVDPAMAEQFLARSGRGGFAIRTATKRPRAAGDIGWDALHVPVLLAGRREGTLSILRIPSEPYSDDERAAVVRLADVTALAWATERYQQERAQMARMRERQRIGDDLHDHVAQILFSAHLTLETVLEELEDDAPLLAPVGHARDLLVRSEFGIREVIDRLSSPGPEDFAGRLAAIVQEVEEDFDVPIHLDVLAARTGLLNGIGRPAVDATLAAAREAMINAAKHAGPCRVLVELSVTPRQRVHVTVVDDGIGPISGSRGGGHGLRAIRRRIRTHGGTVRVSRGVHGGTRVLVSLPLGAGAGSGSEAMD